MRDLKIVLSICVAIFAPMVAMAQISDDELPTATLQNFKSIRVEADMELTLIEIASGENCRLVYDLADNDPAKFKFDVSDKKRLMISQNRNTRSVTPVRATLYYHGVDNISVARGKLFFATPFRASVADVRVEDGGQIIGEVQCDDLLVNNLTESRVELKGVVPYFTLRATTGSKSELKGVEMRSARVDVSHGAVVVMNAGERLDVSASTKAVVKYWNTPKILRVSQGLIGGEILKQE